MMQRLSRDPGLTQFLGICLDPETQEMQLVMEYMQARAAVPLTIPTAYRFSRVAVPLLTAACAHPCGARGGGA